MKYLYISDDDMMHTTTEVTDETRQGVYEGFITLIRCDAAGFEYLNPSIREGSGWGEDRWTVVQAEDGEGLEQELKEDGDIPGTEGDGEDHS